MGAALYLGAALVSVAFAAGVISWAPHYFFAELFRLALNPLSNPVEQAALSGLLVGVAAIVGGTFPRKADAIGEPLRTRSVLGRALSLFLMVVILFSLLLESFVYLRTGSVGGVIMSGVILCGEFPLQTSRLGDMLSVLLSIGIDLPLMCFCLIPLLLPTFIIAAYAEIEFAHRRKERELDQISERKFCS